MYNKIKKIKNGFGQNYDVESCDLRQERPTYESPQNTRWRRIGVFWTSEGRLASPRRLATTRLSRGITEA